jgi:hypothetical protein
MVCRNVPPADDAGGTGVEANVGTELLVGRLPRAAGDGIGVAEAKAGCACMAGRDPWDEELNTGRSWDRTEGAEPPDGRGAKG